MSRLPRLSGEDVVKVLVSKFGFEVSRQRGSHVILIKHVNGLVLWSHCTVNSSRVP
ncbi:type II toxin-antitoxin system HicA family toxin [Thermococcus zilligii]|uniref:type II toxin-antitoxin system HicA family toxin n=1 Tax=Thermococcus zilligii TaxID=54076 RepID=UPI001ED976A1|nr:type II toxin-antitoxin system HicA family toxin [Thermococcus zilligii]